MCVLRANIWKRAIYVAMVMCFTFDVVAQTIKPEEKSKIPGIEKPSPKKEDIEWGDWATKKPSSSKYGVGIRGNIESELSALDKSNLLENPTGVSTDKAPLTKKIKNKASPKDLKRMMKELERIESELTKELNDETEF